MSEELIHLRWYEHDSYCGKDSECSQKYFFTSMSFSAAMDSGDVGITQDVGKVTCLDCLSNALNSGCRLDEDDLQRRISVLKEIANE